MTVPVLGAAPGTTVELIPGKKFLPLPADAAPAAARAPVLNSGTATPSEMQHGWADCHCIDGLRSHDDRALQGRRREQCIDNWRGG